MGAIIAIDGGVLRPQLTHNILAIHHSCTGPHTVILLTTTPTRLATASINAQTHLRWVFGSTVPADGRADGQTPRALLGVHLHKMKCPKQVLRAATLWEEGVPLAQLPCFFDDEHAHPKNSRKCRVSVFAAPTQRDARFWMSRANASKSGMGMWPGAY